MHDDGNIHGDIRCSNILYCDDEAKSQLIDFDLSGPENIKKYPNGFAKDIVDGKRHDDAIPKNVLKKEHDYFSLVYLFKSNITVVKIEKKMKYWNRLCDFLDDGNIDEAITLLIRKKSFDLKPIDDSDQGFSEFSININL